MVTLIHELMANFDKNIQSDLILMDSVKAFDTVLTFMQITVVWCGRQYLLMDSILPLQANTESWAGWCQLLTSNGHFRSSTMIGIGTNIISDFY